MNPDSAQELVDQYIQRNKQRGLIFTNEQRHDLLELFQTMEKVLARQLVKESMKSILKLACNVCPRCNYPLKEVAETLLREKG